MEKTCQCREVDATACFAESLPMPFYRAMAFGLLCDCECHPKLTDDQAVANFARFLREVREKGISPKKEERA